MCDDSSESGRTVYCAPYGGCTCLKFVDEIHECDHSNERAHKLLSFNLLP